MTELEHATRRVTRPDCWYLYWRGWEFYRGQTWLHAFAQREGERYLVDAENFPPWGLAVTRKLFASQCLDIIEYYRDEGLEPLYGPAELHAIQDPNVYVIALAAFERSR